MKGEIRSPCLITLEEVEVEKGESLIKMEKNVEEMSDII